MERMAKRHHEAGNAVMRAPRAARGRQGHADAGGVEGFPMGTLYYGDCLDVLEWMMQNAGVRGKIEVGKVIAARTKA